MFKTSNKEFWLLIALFVCSFILFIWKIGSIPILDGDTAFYGEIAKNILKSNDWLTLHYANPSNIIDKPPLVFWLIAICFKLFGINEFGLSIWHSLMASLTLMITYFTARELFNRKTALVSSLILLTSAQFFYQGRVPLQDLPLTFFIALSLYCFVLFDKYKNYWAGYLIPVFTALAVLVKGPVGLALPALIILVYLIITKKLFSYSRTDYLVHLPLTMLVFLAVVSPWFIVEYKIIGPRIIEVFWTRNFGRFLFPVDTVGATAYAETAKAQYDFYSYFLQLLLVLLPWSGFIYPAIYYHWKKRVEGASVPMNSALKGPLGEYYATSFTLSWALAPIIFFSLSLNYKIARYILPAFPGLAIIIGKLWHDYLENQEKAEKLVRLSNYLNLFLILPALAILVMLAMFMFPKEQAAYQPIVFPVLSILTLGILISVILILKQKRKPAFLSLFIGALIAYFILIGSLNIYFNEANPMAYLSKQIGRTARLQDRVGVYIGSGTSTVNFYSNHKAALINQDEDLKAFLEQKKKAYLLTEQPGRLEEFSEKYPGLVKIVERKNYMILFSN